MGRKKDISVEEKAKIMCWQQEGVKTSEIAERLGRHPSVIRKHVALLKDLPPMTSPPPPKPRPGPKRKISNIMKIRLKMFVMRYPFKTARELKNEVAGWSKISVRRIQEVLQKDLNMPARKAAKKPLLTPQMVKKRLAFCRKFSSWTPEQWEKVMFSDESTFRLINPRGVIVRRPTTLCRYKHRYTISTVKHSASVMVWGCFSGTVGRGGLYFLPKNQTMNGPRYKEVLEEHLVPFMEMHRCTWFLQDGAPCHKSKLVMASLNKLKDKFQVMDWPGNSPDLNPIENCWSHMKRKLKANRAITSLPKLIDAIKEMWVQDLPQSYFKQLAQSMPRRIKAVLHNNGYMTKY